MDSIRIKLNLKNRPNLSPNQKYIKLFLVQFTLINISIDIIYRLIRFVILFPHTEVEFEDTKILEEGSKRKEREACADAQPAG